MEQHTATITNGMPPFSKKATSNGVVIKLENGKATPMLNGGGLQKAKKVYAPNLNVVRQKNKEKEIAKKTIEKNNKIIAARNGQRKPKDEGRFIQSQGLFSDGAGELKRLVRNYNGDTDRQHNSRSAAEDTMLKPRVEINNRKIDKGTEACVVNNLLDCDDPNFLDHLSRDYEPIVLPLSANNKSFLDIFCVTPKVDLVVKQEKVSKENETVPDRCANILFDTQEILHEAPNFLNLGKYTDEDPFISLLRLPDTFPAKGFSDKPMSNGLSESAGEKVSTEQTTQCVDFNISMFDEGQLGTIIVRKSGKIEIKIGQGNYILQSSGESTCTEEAMIIPNNSNDSNSETDINCKDEMIAIADIKEHLTLSPSWEQLFLDKMSKKKNFGHHTS